MRPEDLRRFVVTAHEDGLGLREIVLALREDVENLPEWLRSRSKAELAEIVVDLLPGDEADGDEPLPGDFDPEARDEKRAWEMGYEGELDAR
jgi:hypothetical protein